MNKTYLSVFLGGAVFGLGLAISGMTKQEVVLSFLQLTDLGLLFVMGVGILVTTLSYHFLPLLMKRPILGKEFQTFKTHMTKKRIAGAVLFGIGWGISGVCPGSAIASLGTGNFPVLFGIAGLFLGALVQGKVFGKS